MANFIDTEGYKEFKEGFRTGAIPNHKSLPEGTPSLTVESIFSHEPEELDTFAELDYLSSLDAPIRIDSTETLFDRYLEDRNLEGLASYVRDQLRASLAREYEELGGDAKLKAYRDYFSAYSQTGSLKGPDQRKRVETGHYISGPEDVSGDFGMGMGTVPFTGRSLTSPNPTEEFLELEKEFAADPRDWNPKEYTLLSRGTEQFPSDITTSWMTAFSQGKDFTERFGTEFRYWKLTPDHPLLAQRLLLPEHLTRAEATHFIKKYDPNAVVSYFDPQNIASGLIIKSPLLGKTVSFDDIGDSLIPSSDTTFRTRLENWQGPLTDDLVQMVFGELGPEIVGSGVIAAPMIGMNSILKRGGKEVIARKTGLLAATQRGAMGTTKVVGLAAALSVPAALFKLTTLLYASENGILPMSQTRAWEAAGLFGTQVFLGSLLGDGVMMLGGNIIKRITGKNMDQELLNRVRKAREDSMARGAAAEESEVSYDDANKIINDVSNKVGKKYHNLYMENLPAYDLEGDQVLIDLQSEIFNELSESEPARIAITQMYAERGVQLRDLFESLLDEMGAPKGQAKRDSAYQRYLDKLEQYKKIEAEELAEELDAQSASRLFVDEPDPGDITTVMDEQIAVLPESEGAAGYTNARLMLERKENLNEPTKVLNDLLNSEEVATSGPRTKLSDYVGEAVSDALTGGRAPFKKEDYDEVHEILKQRVPMDKGTSVLKLLMYGKDEGFKGEKGQVVKLDDWSLPEIIEAKFNVLTWLNTDNESLKKATVELIVGLESAIAAGLSKIDPDLAEEIATAMNAKAIAYKNEVDGRLLLNVVRSQDASQLATTVLGMPLKQIEKLKDLLRKTDLENFEVGSRTAALRLSVIEHIRKKVLNPEDDAAKQNKAFREFIRDNEKKMELLFPDKFSAGSGDFDFKDLQDFADWSKKQENLIKVSTRKLETLNDILASGETAQLNPVRLIKDFFEADKMQLEEAGTMGNLRDLSKLADRFPELREAMQGVFVEYMERNLLRPQSTELSPDLKMSTEGFNIDGLLQLVYKGYGGSTGLKRMQSDFRLLLGPDMAEHYVRNLRFLAREVDKMNKAQQRLSWVGKGPGDISGKEGDRTFLRWLMPPLTQAGRRATALVNMMGGASRRHFLEVIADPSKLDALLSLRDRQMDRRTAMKILLLISTNPSEDLGGEIKEFEKSPGERLLEKNILSKTAAEKDPILEGLQKGILDPIVEIIPGLASGGSVAAALQRAEARTRHVQRGR